MVDNCIGIMLMDILEETKRFLSLQWDRIMILKSFVGVLQGEHNQIQAAQADLGIEKFLDCRQVVVIVTL
jgi:hypothetical protein